MALWGKTVKVNVRLFGGLAEDAKLKDYDADKGLTINVPEGTRIKKLAKILGLPERHILAYFIDGKKVGLRDRVRHSCQVICLRPSAGG